MGSDKPEFIEELPVEDITVSSFCIDSHEITNAQFAQFVEDTGYVTIAERPLSKNNFLTYPMKSDRLVLSFLNLPQKVFNKSLI